MEVAKGPDDTADQEFRRIVEMYQTSLLRMCSAQLQDSVLAEDAMQETFIKIYRSLPSFKKEGNEKAWIMKIAVNTCRDMRRSKWFRYVDRRVTPDTLPDEQATIEETDDDLSSAILNLSQKLREVVMLFYYQDMKLNEIAEILAVSVSTVASRLSRARKKLKDALERSDYDD